MNLTDQPPPNAVTPAGLRLECAGGTHWSQPAPLQAQVLGREGRTSWHVGSYSSISRQGDGFLAEGTVALPGAGRLGFVDVWRRREGAWHLSRKVTVEAPGEGRGFLTAFELQSDAPLAMEAVEPFLPAVMYGDNSLLPPGAIGSAPLRQAGVADHLVREECLPAPLVALRDRQGTSVGLWHANPSGRTTVADAHDLIGHTLVDGRFQFASLGLRETDGRLRVSFWYPGTEGAARRVAFDWGKRRFRPHTWRGRYHPLEKGFSHGYELVMAGKKTENFPDLLRWAWGTAFDLLDPQICPHDLAVVESAICAHLSALFEEQPDGACGVPFLVDADTGYVDDGFYGLGFCGRNEAVAQHLIRVGHRDGHSRYLEQGRKILDFWTSRTGPGFTPVAYRPDKSRFGGQDWFIHQRANVPAPPEGEAASLRELAEGHLGCLRAWAIERAQGVDQPRWLAWCLSFGQWLLGQQLPNGGFPRWWRLNGEVLDPSTTGAFNAIPFLCELSQCTKEPAFRTAAERAGEFLWSDPQTRGVFRGGTIDNPDVIDKEAASLSLEAFLALYHCTGQPRWLEAARLAADVAATWTYLWRVPMPEDAERDALDWKPEATTVGAQIVAIGGGGVDQYLAFNAGEFQRLADLTGNTRYRRLAGILLHNTKVMLALPGRTFDLAGPGWQQEHWSLLFPRGCGAHRAWLPWVTVCHLVGLEGCRQAAAQAQERPLEVDPVSR